MSAPEIVNKVSENTQLITIDLQEFFPKNSYANIKISKWLGDDGILREKEFRAILKQHDWSAYQDMLVTIEPLEEAILPSWTYLLVSTYLSGIATMLVLGDKTDLYTTYLDRYIQTLPLDQYTDKNIIIKGCVEIEIPAAAYITLIGKIQPVAKKIMYGEACSTVPLTHKK